MLFLPNSLIKNTAFADRNVFENFYLFGLDI